MDVNKYLSSSTALKAADLKGKEIPLKISGCTEREFEEGTKLELHFESTERTMVLNKTNLAVIVDTYGAETEDWNGQKVILYPTKTSFGSETVDCIRLRVPMTARPDDGDEIPF